MRRPLGDVCLDIASYARERKHEFLSYILRLAAAEAYKSVGDDENIEYDVTQKFQSRNAIVGIWDWDISNDRNHLDAACADFFSVDHVKAARGLPNMHYLSAIHPDDVGRVGAEVQQAMRHGGIFQSEYRLIKNDRVNWVFARGSCTLDKSGRPVRLPGALIDITHEKAMH